MSHCTARGQTDQSRSRNGVNNKYPLQTVVTASSSSPTWVALAPQGCDPGHGDPCGMMADPYQPTWPHGDAGNAHAGLLQGVDATQPCQKHREGMWGAGVSTRGCCVGTTLGGSVPAWCCVSPVSLQRASHERALKHNRSAGPRLGSCTKGVLSDAAAFPVIISLDKIPEQRTDTRIYSLLCISTVHYEV